MTDGQPTRTGRLTNEEDPHPDHRPVGFAFAAQADVTVMSWGGAYGEAQTEATVKPFTAATGIATMMVDSDNPATPIKAMVEANNVTIDVASLEYADAIRLCDEGVLEPIDIAALPAGADGTPAADDFLPGAVTECGVSTDIWSTVFAYDTTKFPEGPTTAADFFDLEKFPGKRGLRKGAKAVLEFALMADGVPAAEVYDGAGTPKASTAPSPSSTPSSRKSSGGKPVPGAAASGGRRSRDDHRLQRPDLQRRRSPKASPSRSSGTARSTKTKCT
jgi:spermidine/putrescine-binding protein